MIWNIKYTLTTNTPKIETKMFNVSTFHLTCFSMFNLKIIIEKMEENKSNFNNDILNRYASIIKLDFDKYYF